MKVKQSKAIVRIIVVKKTFGSIDIDPESISGLNAYTTPRSIFDTNEAYCNVYTFSSAFSEKVKMVSSTVALIK